MGVFGDGGVYCDEVVGVVFLIGNGDIGGFGDGDDVGVGFEGVL